MENFTVYIRDRATKERFVYAEELTEKQAESMCEAWGWFYCDENGKTWYMEYDNENEEKTMGETWKCNICGALIDIDEDFFDDTEEILWGHIQLEHEDIFEECQNWETPWMIEEYFEEEKGDTNNGN